MTQQHEKSLQPGASATSQKDTHAQRQRRLQKFLTLQTKELMTRLVLTVPSDLTLGELEGMFETHDFNGFCVVEGRQLIGVVTKFDFLKTFIFTTKTVYPHYDDLIKRTVREIMTTQPRTVHPATPLTRVLEMIVETRDKSFPVVDDKGRLVGIISRSDIVRALKR